MKAFESRVLWALLSLLPACGNQLVEFPNRAEGGSPTGNADGSTADAGKLDAAVKTDAANSDATAGTVDSGVSPVDAVIGAGDALAGLTDVLAPVGDALAGLLDAAKLDAIASIDAILGDAANIDVPNLGDAAKIDVASIDVANVDVANVDTNLDTANLDSTNVDTNLACALAPVVLGAASNFVVLAGSTVTNTGPTSVTGDLGVSPGTAVTGFPPGTVVGSQHAGTPTAAQAEADLTTAYNNAAGRTLCPVSVAGNLGGMTLTPGLYKSTSSLEISSGDLTLDAQGNADAIFIFQMASTLTTTAGRQVILSGNAKSTNIFWQVGTSATIGSTSAFQGTIMADQAITLNTGATLNGRVLARIAAVSLDSNTIVKPSP